MQNSLTENRFEREKKKKKEKKKDSMKSVSQGVFEFDFFRRCFGAPSQKPEANPHTKGMRRGVILQWAGFVVCRCA